MGEIRPVVRTGPGAAGGGAGGTGGAADAVNGEDRGGGLGGALGEVLLGKLHPREDRLKRRQGDSVTQDDADGVEALIEAVKELGGEVNLGDGMVDVGKAVGEKLHVTSILGDGEIPSFILRYWR